MDVMKSKGQNKTMSLLESAASVFAGYVITVLIQYLLYPLLGITIPVVSALVISAITVLIAFFKNFAIRRVFNLLHIKGVGV